MHEVFEHTADLGLRIEAPDLQELLAEAGRALLSVIVEDPAQIRGRESRSVELAGSDPAYVLHDWLNELLYFFDADGWLSAEFDVRVSDDGVRATVRGERIDPARHVMSHEVKAITYHGLSVERCEQGWRAEVILDI